jgi:hypothetical protein
MISMKGYKDTIKAVALADMGADMFARSAIVGYIFEKPKELVMDDLIKVRREYMMIKRELKKRK